MAARTTGFDEWKAYLLGETDGVPKTPEWQEAETGVPAKDVRALARMWGGKKIYLAVGMSGAGFGGAGRGATGQQWARCMVMMMAMQGWGKPGVNFGGLEIGAPVDLDFYFPGYADGGISGDLAWTGNALNNYQRMPHVLTMNPVKQMVPRQQLPDAIITGHATGYLWDGMSQEIQFAPFTYPMPGYSPIHMIYRYGGSSFSTVTKSSRWVEAYRHESIEFVVNQSIWMEGEAQFADIILPACTSLERWDIGEWSNSGGYLQHGFMRRQPSRHHPAAQVHRTVGRVAVRLRHLHRHPDPAGAGRDLHRRMQRARLGQAGVRFLRSARPHLLEEVLPQGILRGAARKTGAPPAGGHALVRRGRRKDVPEPHPLPSQWAEEFGMGLQTPSGKLEFVPEILKRNTADNPERPPLNRYMPSWEGLRATERAERYPLQMIATHCRYSFHTHADGKNSAVNQVEDHRALVAGHRFYLLRINPADAAARGIGHRDLVKIFNDRGAVICAADVSPLVTLRASSSPTSPAPSSSSSKSREKRSRSAAA